jgi:hypothetical protein
MVTPLCETLEIIARDNAVWAAFLSVSPDVFYLGALALATLLAH